MGMFDDLTVEAALPDALPVPHDFQTKNLDCALDHYRITADGELWVLRYDMVPDPSALADAWWPYKRANEEWKRIEDYHGEIHFYNSVGGVWHEYVARFTDGKLSSIRGGASDE